MTAAPYTIRCDIPSLEPLFSVFESLWPVAFVTAPAASAVAVVGTTLELTLQPHPFCLEVPARDTVETTAGAMACEVLFGDDPEVPWPYRGRKVQTSLIVARTGLEVRPPERVLAADTQGRVLWTVAQQGARRVFRTALTLPTLMADQDIGFDPSSGRFIQLLPLFHLIRVVCGPRDWQPAAVCASYIVDDPNLHWPRYGFVDYQAIARDAARENYHVGFATIPLDTWFTHANTAELFRRYPERLSLLIHGNDHGRNELAQPRSDNEHSALLQHALSRIGMLERRTGLQVDRVMVPPHGACSAATLRHLQLQGFESACISAGSLRFHNRPLVWTHAVGFAPCERVQNCPVLPRWALEQAGDDVLLAAAYLGQPLVLRGHHQDLKHGLEVFSKPARFINSLGPVHWSSMSGLSRHSYQQQRDGSICRIRLFSNRVDVTVPADITSLVIEGPAQAYRVLVHGAPVPGCKEGGELTLTVRPGQRIEVARCVPESASVLSSTPSRTRMALVVRRLLSEARDRLQTI